MRHFLLLSILAAAAGLGGCITVEVPGNGLTTDDAGNIIGADGGPMVKTFPCDVAAVLITNCVSCHNTPSVPPVLLTYADLTSPSTTDPTKTVAQDCVAAMQGTKALMPPGAPPPAIDVQILQNWIKNGYPSGMGCTIDAGIQPSGNDASMPPPPPPPVDAGMDTGTPKDSGMPPTAPTWSSIYNNYFASGTIGNCGPSCHSQAGSASSMYTWMAGKGYISGTSSTIVQSGSSDISWYGGNMPPSGPTSEAKATSDMNAWVAAGALNN